MGGPNYFIFLGYLKMRGRERVSATAICSPLDCILTCVYQIKFSIPYGLVVLEGSIISFRNFQNSFTCRLLGY